MSDKPTDPTPEQLREWRIRAAAQWLREEIWQFLSPKENQFALRLVDELEKEALGRQEKE
jgi:hypothetical protein